MKPLLLIISFLAVVGLYAQSKVKVFSDDGSTFDLYVNGVKQNENPTTNIISDAFVQEFVRVRVKSESQAIDVKKSLALEAGKLTTLMLVERKGVYRLKYYGVSSLDEIQTSPQAEDLKVQEQNATVVNDAGASKKDIEIVNKSEGELIEDSDITMETQVTVKTEDGTITTSTTTTTTTTSGSEVNMHVDHDEFMEFGGEGETQETVEVDMEIDHDEFKEFEGSGEEIPDAPKLHVQPKRYTDEEIEAFKQEKKGLNGDAKTDTVYVVKEVPTEEVEEVDPCDYLTATELGEIKAHMDKEIFSSDKKNVAIQALKHKCFTTEDLRTLMKEFSFDDEKYELAEWGYDTVLDPENYYKMLGDFTFSATKDKLNDLMNK